MITPILNPSLNGDVRGALPPGIIIAFAGAVAPAGWALCYGQEVSRTTYASLFAAIGTTHGTGDGSETFNVPDLRGNVIAGKDDMGGAPAGRLTVGASGVDGATLGSYGGEETHALSDAETGTFQLNNDESGPVSAGTGFAVISQSLADAVAHTNVQPTLVLNYIIKLT